MTQEMGTGQVKKGRQRPAMTSRQRFTIQTVHRSQIQLAEYNPRMIEEDARARLASGIANFGLVEPVVWNVRTGRLVGGHQRIAILDEQEGGLDYELSVSVIDVDERTERKINVILNNPSAQGMWDQAALEQMLTDLARSEPAAIKQVGFDAEELLEICESEDLRKMLEAQVEIDQNAATEEKSEDEGGDGGQAEGEGAPPAATGGEGDGEQSGGTPKKKSGPQVRPEHCVLLVFPTPDELTEFLRQHMLPVDVQYIDGQQFIECVGLRVREVPAFQVAETEEAQVVPEAAPEGSQVE